MMQSKSHFTVNLDPALDALQGPLALIDDQQRREEMRRFVDAARVHQERALFDLVSDVVAGINEATGETRVRLEYQAGHLHIAVDSNTVHEDDAADPMTRMDGDLEKVTIRLPRPLKEHIDRAADERGVSLNSWYVRALARAVFHYMRGSRREGRAEASARPDHRGRRRRGETRSGGPA